jgi:hypothetical protein
LRITLSKSLNTPLPAFVVPLILGVTGGVGAAAAVAGLGLQGAQHSQFIKQAKDQEELVDLQKKLSKHQLKQYEDIEKEMFSRPLNTRTVTPSNMVTRSMTASTSMLQNTAMANNLSNTPIGPIQRGGIPRGGVINPAYKSSNSLLRFPSLQNMSVSSQNIPSDIETIPMRAWPSQPHLARSIVLQTPRNIAAPIIRANIARPSPWLTFFNQHKRKFIIGGTTLGTLIGAGAIAASILKGKSMQRDKVEPKGMFSQLSSGFSSGGGGGGYEFLRSDRVFNRKPVKSKKRLTKKPTKKQVKKPIKNSNSKGVKKNRRDKKATCSINRNGKQVCKKVKFVI